MIWTSCGIRKVQTTDDDDCKMTENYPNVSTLLHTSHNVKTSDKINITFRSDEL